MPVSSKWYVLTPREDDDPRNVRLAPVVRGIENRQWAAATPGGEMRMWIENPPAREQFVPGEEYEAVFVHCPKPAPGDGHAVQQVEQHWSGAPEKVYYVCGVCGSYAAMSEDGTPSWAKHEEMFGVPTDETGDSELVSQ